MMSELVIFDTLVGSVLVKPGQIIKLVETNVSGKVGVGFSFFSLRGYP